MLLLPINCEVDNHLACAVLFAFTRRCERPTLSARLAPDSPSSARSLVATNLASRDATTAATLHLSSSTSRTIASPHHLPPPPPPHRLASSACRLRCVYLEYRSASLPQQLRSFSRRFWKLRAARFSDPCRHSHRLQRAVTREACAVDSSPSWRSPIPATASPRTL